MLQESVINTKLDIFDIYTAASLKYTFNIF